MNEILRVETLSKSFVKKKVLKNINLTLEEGKVYGFLGKNGEGKTTLVRILMGAIPPDSGEVFYKNRKILFGDSSYKHQVGFIPEEAIYFSRMSIRELLDFNAAFYPSWNARKAAEYLDRFSLDPGVKIRNLSRGMKLKLGIIVTLSSEPKVLILDDPTSGLDVLTRHDFLKEIIKELSEAGTTILFCTHMVHEIEGIVDHLSILDDGVLILDEGIQKIREFARKISLSFDEPAAKEIRLDGILSRRDNGNRSELIVYPWTQEKISCVQELGPARLEDDPLSLEEVFIHFVSSNKKKPA